MLCIILLHLPSMKESYIYCSFKAFSSNGALGSLFIMELIAEPSPISFLNLTQSKASIFSLFTFVCEHAYNKRTEVPTH